jgi:hypothetical protein
MKQIYHNYTLWEDWLNGMWRKVTQSEENKMLPIAIEFTGNAEKYGNAMMRVINEWPITCEHNLTDNSQNRRAFLGHCAVCLQLGIPEYITRLAWHQLSQKQQDEANDKADYAIEQFEIKLKSKIYNHAQTVIEF